MHLGQEEGGLGKGSEKERAGGERKKLF